MAKDITIFTTNTCAYCVMVKKWLDTKGHSYNVVNLDDHPERQAEALEISGALTVPITVVTKQDDSKEVVVGFNLSKLAPAVA
jgi:glutaredoxin 3